MSQAQVHPHLESLPADPAGGRGGREPRDQDSPTRADDVLALTFVFVVTLAATWLAVLYVLRWGSAMPVQDDLELAYAMVPGYQVTWEHLWTAANEHRILLTRLIFLGLLDVTGDFRSTLYFMVATHALMALGMVALVRRLRGRTTYADAFFPIFWLSLANAENFLLGMQISTDAAVVLVLVVLAAGIWDARPPTTTRAVVIATSLLVLPTTGGFGLSQIPPLALWAAVAAWFAWKQPATRRAAIVLAIGLVLLAILIGFYMHDLRSPTMERAPFDFVTFLATAGQVLTLNLGPIAAEWPIFGALATLAVAGTAIGLCVRVFLREPSERWRAGMCLCALGAPIVTGLAIGLGRQSEWPYGGWANRYVTLPSALFAVSFVVFVLYGHVALRRAFQGGLFAVFAALHWHHHDYAIQYAKAHDYPIQRLIADVEAGVPLDVLGQRYSPHLYPSAMGLTYRLQWLREGRMPPFDDLPPRVEPSPAGGSLPTVLGVQFQELGSPATARLEERTGRWYVRQSPGSDFEIQVPTGTTAISGEFCVPRDAYRMQRLDDVLSGGVRVEVVALNRRGREHVALTRDLEPMVKQEDRFSKSFDLPLPPGTERVRLRVSRLSQLSPERDGVLWRAVELR